MRIRQIVLLIHHLYVPAFFAEGSTLSNFWKSRGHRYRPFPPPLCASFFSRIGFSIPTARRISSNVANSRSRACHQSFFAQEKPTSTHSARLEPTKLNFVGTRTTYRVTGDAGSHMLRADSCSTTVQLSITVHALLNVIRQYGPRGRLPLAVDAFGSALVTHTRCLTMLEL